MKVSSSDLFQMAKASLIPLSICCGTNFFTILATNKLCKVGHNKVHKVAVDILGLLGGTILVKMFTNSLDRYTGIVITKCIALKLALPFSLIGIFVHHMFFSKGDEGGNNPPGEGNLRLPPTTDGNLTKQDRLGSPASSLHTQPTLLVRPHPGNPNDAQEGNLGAGGFGQSHLRRADRIQTCAENLVDDNNIAFNFD